MGSRAHIVKLKDKQTLTAFGLLNTKRINMKNKHLLLPKGYTLSITSWENDGDYYHTKGYTVDSKDVAKEILDFCNLCKSGSNNTTTVGDGYGSRRRHLIVDFFKRHTLLADYLGINLEDEDSIMDAFYDLSYDLLGSSEDYDCRVFSAATVVYSPVDVYAEKVTL